MRQVLLDPAALEDLQWWLQKDRRTATKILGLIEEAARDPFQGRGRPEALKFELSGCWSRRINLEHRLVYEVGEDILRVLSCRFHYR
ncbi:toxin YoeB [Thiohalospira halophila DSM 15071]|uniref:Putative mRNA interferase YoeB n=1 Tax=Thiohalospira halophila DSM 15071 TaxID=1123397 RepID=A0A1I1NAN8_9GAMM|nr:Txe/YoeB family addiction module toxin [Thiohalospira halophila]SFC94617.1 toxin YoeB [Thiohalospira halophila DSM 15071]